MEFNMQILKAPFFGTEIVVVEYDNKPYVPMKPICENIGLAWHAQFERLKRKEVLSSGIRIIRTPSNGGEQESVCLPLHYLNGWLFGIDTNRVKPELKEKLVRYQKECYEVLWDYWTTGTARRDEIQERLNRLLEDEGKSRANGSIAGKLLNQRKQEKAHFEVELARLKQMDLFLDI